MPLILSALKRFLTKNGYFFVICILFLFAGVLAGSFFCVRMSEHNASLVLVRLEEIRRAAEIDYRAGFISSVCNYACTGAFLWVCGLTYFGAVISPAVLFLRGFISSFCVACFVKFYGARGFLAIFAMVFPSVAVLIPVLFVFCVYTMRRALVAGRPDGQGFLKYSSFCIIMSLAFFICAFYDSYIASYIMINMF